jgi:hypothetical protein
LRQAVLVARELERVLTRLHEELELGEPFSDPFAFAPKPPARLR